MRVEGRPAGLETKGLPTSRGRKKMYLGRKLNAPGTQPGRKGFFDPTARINVTVNGLQSANLQHETYSTVKLTPVLIIPFR